jgi:predicted nuclease with TOPRIM domain
METQALRAAVNQLSQDLGNLLTQRNLTALQLQAAQTELAELKHTLEGANAAKADLEEQVDHLKDCWNTTANRADELDAKLDRAVAFMSAENALAFTTGGEPFPDEPSGR